jgi:hypothetical protein
MDTKSKVRYSGFAILFYLMVAYSVGVHYVHEDMVGIYIFFAIVGISILNAYWGLNIIKLRREVRERRKKRTLPEPLRNLDKEFDYYCPSCLYQANVDFKKCPKCKNGIAKKSKSYQ